VLRGPTAALEPPAGRAPVRTPTPRGRTPSRLVPGESRMPPLDEPLGHPRPVSLTPPPVRPIAKPPAARRGPYVVAGAVVAVVAAVLTLGPWIVGGHVTRMLAAWHPPVVPAARPSAVPVVEASGEAVPDVAPSVASAASVAAPPAVREVPGSVTATEAGDVVETATEHSVVRLVGLPPGAEATVDDRPVEAEFVLAATYAEHTLRVRARGFRTVVRAFRAPHDLTLRIQADPVRPARQEPGASGAPASAPPVEFQQLGNPFAQP